MDVAQPAATKSPGLSSRPGAHHLCRGPTKPLQRKGSSLSSRCMRELCSSSQKARTGYEVKFDSYRCLAGRDSTGFTLWSRRANRFTDQFPTVVAACEHLAPDTLLDGELIALDKDDRVSFNMLQHHRSQAQAILFYAFDVIIPSRSASHSCTA
jgi:hypothetical protein